MDGAGHQRLVGERLLLEPQAGARDLGEQVAADGVGGVGGQERVQLAGLVGAEGQAAVGVPAMRGDVHQERREAEAAPARERAQDEHAGSVEVPGVPAGHAEPGPGHVAQQRDGRPAGLALGADDQLAGQLGPRRQRLDIVQEGRPILEHGDKLNGQVDQLGVAELREGQAAGVPELGVACDVIEAVALLDIDERPEAQHRQRPFVTGNAAGLERTEGGVLGGHGLAIGVHVGAHAGVVPVEREADAPQPIRSGDEHLRVPERARREVGQAHGPVEGQRRIDGAHDQADLVRGGVQAAHLRDRQELAGLGPAGREPAPRRRGDGASRGVGEQGVEPAAQGALFGGGITNRTSEQPVEQLVEPSGAFQVETNATVTGRADRPRRQQAAQRGGARGRRVDGDPLRHAARGLPPIQDPVQDGGQLGRREQEPAQLGERGVVHAGDDSIEARRARAARLLGAEREQAIDDGLAPLLLTAFDGPVAHALVSERAPHYLGLMYLMLALRRAHELEPLHEELWRRAVSGQRALDGGYWAESFAADLEQLEAWGAVGRHAEPLRIRGYRDNRRQRFRWHLTDDAVSMLEWIETRLADRHAGRAGDSRDRLADVLGQLRELARVLEAARKEGIDAENARRAVHLLGAVDDAVHEITRELLGFRGAMIEFAARPYQLASLKQILGWLERYVAVYLARIETLRVEIVERLAHVALPRFRKALAEARARLLVELESLPRGLRGAGSLRGTDDLIDAQLPFFAAGGGLATLCHKIEDSAREVLRKMSRHVRELKRRSARVAELRATIAELARGPAEGRVYAELVNALVGGANHRFDARAAATGQRVTPALPRSQRTSAAPRRAVSLATKAASPDEVRALRAQREALLAAWLADTLLATRAEVRLSEAPPQGPDAPRRWLDVARAQHLGSGRGLARLGVEVVAAPGRTRVGSEAVGLEVPDAIVSRRLP